MLLQRKKNNLDRNFIGIFNIEQISSFLGLNGYNVSISGFKDFQFQFFLKLLKKKEGVFLLILFIVISTSRFVLSKIFRSLG